MFGGASTNPKGNYTTLTFKASAIYIPTDKKDPEDKLIVELQDNGGPVYFSFNGDKQLTANLIRWSKKELLNR